jgi:hypothetical protein
MLSYIDNGTLHIAPSEQVRCGLLTDEGNSDEDDSWINT